MSGGKRGNIPPANPGLTPVQKAVLPSSQFWQRPSATLKGITTRSPFFSSETPLPSSSTMPMFSCPIVRIRELFVHVCHGRPSGGLEVLGLVSWRQVKMLTEGDASLCTCPSLILLTMSVRCLGESWARCLPYHVKI